MNDKCDDLMHNIKSRAALKWPCDYVMQKHESDSQVSALGISLELLKEYQTKYPAILAIWDRATKEWPEDYEMQLYEMKQQFEAYLNINE